MTYIFRPKKRLSCHHRRWVASTVVRRIWIDLSKFLTDRVLF
jgi:hypothetical protein